MTDPDAFDYIIGIALGIGVLAGVIALARVLLGPRTIDERLHESARRAQNARVARGYDPEARVYPHPWEGKQARLLIGLPELGLDAGAIGRIKYAYVGDDTELFIYFDGRERPIIMLERERGVCFEVLL